MQFNGYNTKRVYNLFVVSTLKTMQKNQVRKNRDRIRQKIKTSILSDSTGPFNRSINMIRVQTPHVALKRRKSSEDVRIMDDLTYLKEIYVQNCFLDLFQLQQKIGEGSHYVVFKCSQIKSGKTYAVKIKSVQRQNLRQVKQHYRIKRSLSHENMIKAYYLFINEKLKKIHMVCEYCPYPDLRAYIKKTKKIKQFKIAQILYSLLSVISYLHKNGVCHRDIKPQNIMYNYKTGQLKLIDFQIAKMCKYTSQRLQMWTNTGTLYYKAPQMFNGSYNQAIDVWSVGVIAFQMIYRRLPFDNDYCSQTIKAICEQQPDYQTADISPFLLHFIKRCLKKNPLKRMTAVEALQTPFLLNLSQSSTSSSRTKKKSISNTDQEDERGDIFCVKQIPKISYNQEDLLNQKDTFSEDIGIRFLSH